MLADPRDRREGASGVEGWRESGPDARRLATVRCVRCFIWTSANASRGLRRRCAQLLPLARDARVHQLGAVRTHHVSAYVEVLTRSYKAPTVKQHLAAARKRAHELSNRMLVVQGAADRAEAEADELRPQAEAALIAQAEADAEELRQADAARRGRGRLARLRAAWRGE